MPQRKYFGATKILVFDFELFIGDCHVSTSKSVTCLPIHNLMNTTNDRPSHRKHLQGRFTLSIFVLFFLLVGKTFISTASWPLSLPRLFLYYSSFRLTPLASCIECLTILLRVYLYSKGLATFASYWFFVQFMTKYSDYWCHFENKRGPYHTVQTPLKVRTGNRTSLFV
jgi:hypothetical protein